jgi:hypothetical protein
MSVQIDGTETSSMSRNAVEKTIHSTQRVTFRVGHFHWR